MKANISGINFFITFLLVIMVYNTSSAQARYKHIPRIKLDKNREMIRPTNQEKKPQPTTKIFNKITETVPTKATEIKNNENYTLASSTKELVVVENKPNTRHTINKNMKNKLYAVAQHHQVVKEKRRLYEVKEAKRINGAKSIYKLSSAPGAKSIKSEGFKLSSAPKINKIIGEPMQKWVLWMIILYAAGALFLILGFIFLAVSYYYLVLYYVLIIIGAVCLLAASIIPISALTGQWYKK